MTDEEKLEQEYQDSLKPDESGELNTTDDSADAGDDSTTEPLSEEEIAEKLKELKNTKATNAKLYARAKKAEEALKEGRKDASEDKIKPETPIDPWKAKMEFIIKHKDLDEEQLDYIVAIAKGKDVSLDEAYKDKFVLKTIEEDARQKKIANATPSGKSQSPEYKDFKQQIANATDRETHKKLARQAMEKGERGVQAE